MPQKSEETLDETEQPDAGLVELTSLREENLNSEAILNLKPNEGESKVKGITVCHAGTSRSAIMRDLLNERGYDVKNYGVGGSAPFDEELVKAIGRGEIQFILCAEPEIAEKFITRFETLAKDTGVKLNIPIRFIDLPEGPGIGWWRTHRDTLDDPSTYRNNSYPPEAYDDVVGYANYEFDKLGFKDRSSKVVTTE